MYFNYKRVTLVARVVRFHLTHKHVHGLVMGYSFQVSSRHSNRKKNGQEANWVDHTDVVRIRDNVTAPYRYWVEQNN